MACNFEPNLAEFAISRLVTDDNNLLDIDDILSKNNIFLSDYELMFKYFSMDVSDSMLKFLLKYYGEKNANKISCLYDDGTLLNYAIESNKSVWIIKEIIAVGGDINHETKPYGTALMQAINLNKGVDFIEKLIELGADVNRIDQHNHMTALHIARSKEVVSLLVRYKADVSLKNGYSETTLMYYLLQRRSPDCILELLKHCDSSIVNTYDPNTGYFPICIAIRLKSYKVVVWRLLEIGVHINMKNRFNETALIVALRDTADVEVITKLLEYGSDVTVTYEGNTVLHYVKNPVVLKKLLRYGAYDIINKTNDEGETPLCHAIKVAESFELIKLFLINGANPNALDFNKCTPLFYVRDITILHLLLLFGANLTIVNANGETPLYHIGVRFRYHFMVYRDMYHSSQAIFNFFMKYILLLEQKCPMYHKYALTNRRVIRKYENELNSMKSEMIFGNLSYYEFTKVTKFKKSSIFSYSDDYLCNVHHYIRKKFPYYSDIIFTNIEKYRMYRFEHNLKKMLYNLIVKPVLNCDSVNSTIKLDYDSLSILLDYLNLNDLYSLFMASIDD